MHVLVVDDMRFVYVHLGVMIGRVNEVYELDWSKARIPLDLSGYIVAATTFSSPIGVYVCAPV
jgi:hypothetical protein